MIKNEINLEKREHEKSMNENQILVIEDEPSVGEVVSLYLRRAGYSVTLVRMDKTALAALERQMARAEGCQGWSSWI